MNATEENYVKAIDDLLTNLKGYKSKYTAKKVASIIGISEFAISKARSKQLLGSKFGGLLRHELLNRIIEKTDNVFTANYDPENGEIVISRRVDYSGNVPEENIYIYKTYYWRGRPVGVGVGLMRIEAKNGKWDQAALIINNKYPSFRDDEPYFLNSTKIDSLGKNTFIEFKDEADLSYKQSGIFRTSKSELKKRKIVEGIFASITRNENKPIAGIMVMELLSELEKDAYLSAEKQDILKQHSEKKRDIFEHRQQILSDMIDVPPVIYATLYRKRIQTTGKDIFEINVLPAYESGQYLSNYVGVYEGHFIRAKDSKLEVFLLQLYKNGNAIIYFPSAFDTKIRSSPEGHFKWVNKPKALLTANFDYQPDEDHWRFRFIIDGEFKYGNCLYGVFAGTEFQSVEPVSGRLRLKKIGDSNQSSAKETDINSYMHILRQIDIDSEDYWHLMDSDINLREFFSSQINPTYTDGLYTLSLIEQETIVDSEPDYPETPFVFSGDYEIYSLYRNEDHDEGYKYYILKQPIRINDDKSVEMKIRGRITISGEAIFSMPVLKINFDDSYTAYSHILLTVNQLHYDQIDRVYGVLTGVHVKKNRSEATTAVLVGPHTKKDEVKRSLNFDINKYEEYEVGSDEFFNLDLKKPSKIGAFLSGHYNRYISPPGRPNIKMQSRLSPYRLPFFKAACYSATKYAKALKSQDSVTSVQDFDLTPEGYQSDCLKSVEEAFQHGFCDPTYFREGINDAIHPRHDVDLLVNELLPRGSLELLVGPVLDLCDKWKRVDVRKRYDFRLGNLTIEF